jgi:hypothetical protein
MVEEQVLPHEGRVDQLRHLCKADPGPQVRRRAHGTARHRGTDGRVRWCSMVPRAESDRIRMVA